MKIQTLWEIEYGEEFGFFGVPSKPLKVGSVVEIHNHLKPVYGKAKVVEVLRENEYKAIRIREDG